MNLPIYQHILIKTTNPEELEKILIPQLNLRRPVVFDILNLNEEDQREVIGGIENYFYIRQLSFHFPYPIYILSILDQGISQITLVKDQASLPRFYSQKEGKIHSKEHDILEKTKLLQQQIFNNDGVKSKEQIFNYAEEHRDIYYLEQERIFYREIEIQLQKKNYGQKKTNS